MALVKERCISCCHFLIQSLQNAKGVGGSGGFQTHLQHPLLAKHPPSAGGVPSTAPALAALLLSAAAGGAPSASSPRTWHCCRCGHSWMWCHHPSPAQHTPDHHVRPLLLLQKIAHQLEIRSPCNASTLNQRYWQSMQVSWCAGKTLPACQLEQGMALYKPCMEACLSLQDAWMFLR